MKTWNYAEIWKVSFNKINRFHCHICRFFSLRFFHFYYQFHSTCKFVQFSTFRKLSEPKSASTYLKLVLRIKEDISTISAPSWRCSYVFRFKGGNRCFRKFRFNCQVNKTYQRDLPLDAPIRYHLYRDQTTSEEICGWEEDQMQG